jgi:hypothetical protein
MKTAATWRVTGKALALVLSIGFCMGFTGCAEQGLTRAMNGAQPFLSQPDYFPGGYWMYSFGSGQTRDNFANVEFAQSYYGLWSGRRWGALGPLSRASTHTIGLQAYYPLHVRWKLKDGREFILENIDTAALMREYFKTHDLKLQWQREGRLQAKVGEGSPLLAHEVKNDTVILKWVITINRTPVDKRLTATGTANFWDTYDEEHIVAILKGNPTSGIDFNNTYEFKR